MDTNERLEWRKLLGKIDDLTKSLEKINYSLQQINDQLEVFNEIAREKLKENDEQMDISKIKFDEAYINVDYGTTTYYFIAPKEMLGDKHPEAESMEISVEFPTTDPEPAYSYVMFSPTKDGEDYDWFDVDLPYEDIEKLIKLGRKNEHYKGEN